MTLPRIPSLIFALVTGLSALAHGGGAIICTGDSKGACEGKQYCCYSGSESDGDKMCKQLGCRRGGTSSCPTAANVKSCGTRVNVRQVVQDIPWCAPPLAS